MAHLMLRRFTKSHVKAPATPMIEGSRSRYGFKNPYRGGVVALSRDFLWLAILSFVPMTPDFVPSPTALPARPTPVPMALAAATGCPLAMSWPAALAPRPMSPGADAMVLPAHTLRWESVLSSSLPVFSRLLSA